MRRLNSNLSSIPEGDLSLHQVTCILEITPINYLLNLKIKSKQNNIWRTPSPTPGFLCPLAFGGGRRAWPTSQRTFCFSGQIVDSRPGIEIIPAACCDVIQLFMDSMPGIESIIMTNDHPPSDDERRVDWATIWSCPHSGVGLGCLEHSTWKVEKIFLPMVLQLVIKGPWSCLLHCLGSSLWTSWRRGWLGGAENFGRIHRCCKCLKMQRSLSD